MPKPSKDDMKRVFELWDKDEKMAHYRREEDELKKLLNKYRENVDLDKVIQKVAIINKFYSAGIRRLEISYEDMAKHILSVNFDKRVQGWDERLVADLAAPFAKKPYSFASVYCVLHNRLVYGQDDYVINTGIVRNKLNEFKKAYPKCKFAKFTERDFKLENYKKFKRILESFRDVFKLDCSLRNVDWYLWKMGKLGE